MVVERTTRSRPYSLTVRTSRNSSTALWLEAQCDADAVTKALRVLGRFGTFCERPTFEVMRWDGTLVEVRQHIAGPSAEPQIDAAQH